MALLPLARATVALKLVPVTFAGLPFTATVTESVGSAGVATPVTATELLDVLEPSAGEAMLTVGGVPLARTETTVCDVFWAESVATKVSVFAPA
jgi:hypothetical protein